MHVELLESLDSEDNRGVRAWRDVVDEVHRTDGKGERAKARQDFVDSHANTIRLLGAADYHHHNLAQIYQPDITPMDKLTTIWVTIEAESIILVLYGALDSLMQEVNLAYKFGIDENAVHIYHRKDHQSEPRADCARCELGKQRDGLAEYFEEELSSGWFEGFRQLRNRITHRRLLATNTNFTVGRPTVYIEIPADPRAIRFTEQSRQRLEITAYCQASRTNVSDVMSRTYEALVQKVKNI